MVSLATYNYGALCLNSLFFLFVFLNVTFKSDAAPRQTYQGSVNLFEEKGK